MDTQLGMISVGNVDANFIRVLVKLNAIKLPDDEALQQDNICSASSAMRVKRSFDCLLSKGSQPLQVKLRAAGPASVVNWMLQGREGKVHQAVSQTEKADEWNVLWHVSVHAAHVEAVTDYYFVALAAAEINALTYDTKWTPVKRLHAMRDSMPEEARSSVAWSGTLPLPSEPTPEMEDAAM